MATASLNNAANEKADNLLSTLETEILRVLRLLGSLKITCVMFALGVLILFVGTLAQDEATLPDVKRDYFNSWIAWVPFDVFVPITIWPKHSRLLGGFPMPGGALIGLTLLVNLVAAKMTRFKMTARGGRFFAGLGLTALGFGLIAMIVFGAHLEDGLQGEPWFKAKYGYDPIWYGCLTAVWAGFIGALAGAVLNPPKLWILRTLLWVLILVLLAVGLFYAATGNTYRIPDPGLRIVWQLGKSLIVSLVMLSGLTLLFGARGGNVLIHLGIGLLMVGQFAFGDRQREERISLYEGQRTKVAVEMDTVELAVVDKTLPDKNRVVAFDDPLIQRALSGGKVLTEASLPFEIKVEEWMVNSDLIDRKSDPEASQKFDGVAGLPPALGVVEKSKSGGAKSETNFATAFLSVREKKTSRELGRFVVSQLLNDPVLRPRPFLPSIESGGREFELALRFRRNQKPFAFELKDVVLEKYTGTETPKDYSSYVRIVDDSGTTLQEGRIWMNSPMRFQGETYYQSQYTSAAQSPLGVEQTVLQVVTNAGWLIPYVSCVLVGLGMLAHFGITLVRFASRYERGAIPMVREHSFSWFEVLLALFCVAAAFGQFLVPRSKSENEIDWYAIGELPVQHEGRIKPLSSAGAQILKALSNKPYALAIDGHSYAGGQTTGREIKASEWLMSVMVHQEWVMKAPLIRIDSQKLLDDLELKRHKSNRYSVKEITDQLDTKQDQFAAIFSKKQEEWTFEERKFMDLQSKLGIFFAIWNAYEPIDQLLAKVANDPQRLTAVIQGLKPLIDSIQAKSIPAIIPPTDLPKEIDPKLPPPRWNSFVPAFYESVVNFDAGKIKDSPTTKFRELADAIRKGNNERKNVERTLKDYKELLSDKYGAVSKTSKASFEAWYEDFNPISRSYSLYLICGLMALVALATGSERVRKTAFWIAVLTLFFHTIAIVSRIYISERPPVVSLYSASVFIGWAIVLACIVAEILFPISISLIIASIAGYLSLLVAYGLDLGDSMPVLQAVLDTQFWLSTHVISVSLGYSATFLAGFLGIGIVIVSLMRLSKAWNEKLSSTLDILYRIAYGVVCFGIFFSFVGTVLGGLWGDDSWGRFWGWDPKENGALMIVLWNALLLHAKWDRLVGPLGFANLAIFGNIITAWSMFGTNILGVGLHAYGGETGESLRNLGMFATSQMLMIGIGGLVYLLNKQQTETKPAVAKARTR